MIGSRWLGRGSDSARHGCVTPPVGWPDVIGCCGEARPGLPSDASQPAGLAPPPPTTSRPAAVTRAPTKRSSACGGPVDRDGLVLEVVDRQGRYRAGAGARAAPRTSTQRVNQVRRGSTVTSVRTARAPTSGPFAPQNSAPKTAPAGHHPHVRIRANRFEIRSIRSGDGQHGVEQVATPGCVVQAVHAGLRVQLEHGVVVPDPRLSLSTRTKGQRSRPRSGCGPGRPRGSPPRSGRSSGRNDPPPR